MRKKLKKKEFNLGARRNVKRFLVLPRIINRELRWLEKAEWVQEYIPVTVTYIRGGAEAYRWIDIRWVN